MNQSTDRIAYCESFARQWLLDHGYLSMQFHGWTDAGQSYLIAAPDIGSAKQKDYLVNRVRLIYLANNVTASVMLSESWYKETPQGSPESEELLRTGRSIANDADRKECITMLYEDADGMNVMRMIPFVRGQHSKIEFQSAVSLPQAKGRFTGLVPKRSHRVTDEERELARKVLRMYDTLGIDDKEKLH